MIRPPSKRGPRLAFAVALLGAIGIGVASLFWSQAQTAKMLSARMRPHETPVPSDAELRRQLSQEQYHVTRENGTETAFRNPYWDNDRAGIYVDLITNEPLFSSLDKYDSGTGWPSFTKPIEPNRIVLKSDHSYGMVRTEVRAQKSDSHLGHLFDDGPPPTKLRYSVNSAALRFIPVEKLKFEGLSQYQSLFEQPKNQTDQARNEVPDFPGT